MGASDEEYEDVMDCEVESCPRCGELYDDCQCEDYW